MARAKTHAQILKVKHLPGARPTIHYPSTYPQASSFKLPHRHRHPLGSISSIAAYSREGESTEQQIHPSELLLRQHCSQ
eukprot:scaffold257242_cov14-Tisochrysis_lutea.AAC.1